MPSSFTINDIIKNCKLKFEDKTITLNDDYLFEIKDNIINIDERIIDSIIELNTIIEKTLHVSNHNKYIIYDEAPSTILHLFKYFYDYKYENFINFLSKYLCLYNFYNLFLLMKKINMCDEIVNYFVKYTKKDHNYICQYKDDIDFVILYANDDYTLLPKINYIKIFEYNKFVPTNKLIYWLISPEKQKAIMRENLVNSLIAIFQNENYFVYENEICDILTQIIKHADSYEIYNSDIQKILLHILFKIDDVNKLFCDFVFSKKHSDSHKNIIIDTIIINEKFDPNYVCPSGNKILKECIFTNDCSDEMKLKIAKKIISNQKFI